MSNLTCSTPDCGGDRYGRMEVCHPCYRRAYYQANKARLTEKHRAWVAANAERVKAKSAERYQANREQVAAQHREYRLAHLEQEKAAKRAYYLANREEIIAKATEANKRRSLEKRRESVAAWRKAHPGETREFWRRRHARKQGAYVTKADYAAVLAEFGMVCHLCGDDIPSMDALDFDHVVPLARGGAHASENIRPSHRSCNRSKGAKLTL